MIREPKGLSMNLRFKTMWYVALALVAAAVATARTFPGPLGASSVRAAEQQEQKKADKLPPLTVDSSAPLLLDEGTKPAGDKAVAPSVAENAACYVCHSNYQEEELVTLHAAGDTGCIDCHGKSYKHRNDENNTTPPDVMFPREKIEDACGKCHETHNAPAARVIARLRERMPRLTEVEQATCTDCHGHHRLARRTVRWNRTTGELLAANSGAPAQSATPRLDALKALAGTWVTADEQGQATDQVVAIYRVTAANTAVVEVLFPGTDHEMVTVYHQDGDDLFLTHYCAAGNQPRMKCRASASADPRIFEFEFVDATNMRSLQEPHMHAATLTIVDAQHLQAKWQGYADGKPAEPHTFNLVRQ